jgi:hypothetical protein
MDIAFIEDSNKLINKMKSYKKEEKHEQLFNEMWNKYTDDEFNTYINRYVHRIQVNNLTEIIKDKHYTDSENSEDYPVDLTRIMTQTELSQIPMAGRNMVKGTYEFSVD